MMSKGGNNKKLRKQDYFKRLEGYLTTYSKVLIVTANNIGSDQMHKIRASLRGQAVMLMGKNTMIRKCIREHLGKNASFEPLLSHIKGYVGFVFTNDDLLEVRNKLTALNVTAAAKAGMIAPCDVVVSARSTGLDPTKISFFHALSLRSKITRGSIELVDDVKLIKAGEKVTASQAALLQMLNIQPFQYRLNIKTVYDEGHVDSGRMLIHSDVDMLARFRQGVINIAALSMQLGIPTAASAPYALRNSYRDILSLARSTDCSFPGADITGDLFGDGQIASDASTSRGSTFLDTSETKADDDDIFCYSSICGFGDEDEEY